MSTRATESVWDYPRPPRWEPVADPVRVEHGGVVLADTRQAVRVLETSHPPVFYLPPADVRMDLLRPSPRRGSVCEWKGEATYWDLLVPGAAPVAAAAWSYRRPTAAFRVLQHHLAFYASRVEVCFVAEERVQPQAGDFYGGWITSWVRGPFKGEPGTWGW